MDKPINNFLRTTFLFVAFFLSACTSSNAPTSTQTPAPTQTPELISQSLIDEIDQHYEILASTANFSGSILIAHGKNILLSEGYGLADVENEIHNTAQSKFWIGSITKQITAGAVMILHERGEFELVDPVCEYLPECPEDWQEVTIHHLLTHTSGIQWNFPEEKNVEGVSYTPAENISWYWDDSLQFEPGAGFSYSNTGYLILGYLIEQVSGQSYQDFVQVEILDPLGMQDSGYLEEGVDTVIGYSSYGFEAEYLNLSIPYAAGGYYSTVEDLYRWRQSFNTYEILSQESVELVFTPFITMRIGNNYSYGYGWVVGDKHGRSIAEHNGIIDGFFSRIEIYPGDDITIIILTNLERPTMEHFDYLAEMIFGEE